MRYFLAVDSYLSTLSIPTPERFKASAERWFAATERYALQLRELDRDTYVAMKLAEYQRQKLGIAGHATISPARRIATSCQGRQQSLRESIRARSTLTNSAATLRDDELITPRSTTYAALRRRIRPTEVRRVDMSALRSSSSRSLDPRRRPCISRLMSLTDEQDAGEASSLPVVVWIDISVVALDSFVVSPHVGS